MLYDKSREKNDVKLYYITVMILKYIKKVCDELGIETKTLTVSDKFDLAPIYEYIRVNDIHLYNLETIADGDLDPNNPDDVERFILSHIRYIFTRMRATDKWQV